MIYLNSMKILKKREIEYLCNERMHAFCLLRTSKRHLNSVRLNVRSSTMNGNSPRYNMSTSYPFWQRYGDCNRTVKCIHLFSSGQWGGTIIVLKPIKYDKKQMWTHWDMTYAPHNPVWQRYDNCDGTIKHVPLVSSQP